MINPLEKMLFYSNLDVLTWNLFFVFSFVAIVFLFGGLLNIAHIQWIWFVFWGIVLMLAGISYLANHYCKKCMLWWEDIVETEKKFRT